jgi:DNA-binding transcriptional ArsR family regulator
MTTQLELDGTSLKAMAHPLRVQILRILELRRRASVTSLAEELGETTGATSYHLRQLAQHGFVEQFEPDDLPAGKRSAGRKQRWWRMAVDEIHMTGLAFLENADTREAAGFLLREFQSDRSRRLANWFATATQWPVQWQKASSDMDGHLELSAAQARALADEMRSLVDKYRALKPGRGARPVDVQYAVFPADTGSIPS